MTVQIGQNESALVCAARQGDREALQLLLARNWAWLKGLVFSIIGPGEVDDVLQDICVRVIAKIETLREPERLRPWLAALARRQALRHRQQTARRPPAARDEESVRRKPDEKADEGLETVERREQCRRIWEAAQLLPEKYRQVFVLQHAGDLSYAQIAEILDVPISTVQIRLVRARRMICDRLAKRSFKKVTEE